MDNLIKKYRVLDGALLGQVSDIVTEILFGWYSPENGRALFEASVVWPINGAARIVGHVRLIGEIAGMGKQYQMSPAQMISALRTRGFVEYGCAAA